MVLILEGLLIPGGIGAFILGYGIGMVVVGVLGTHQWHNHIKDLPFIVNRHEALIQGAWDKDNILTVAPGEKKTQTIFIRKKKILHKTFHVSLQRQTAQDVNFRVELERR